MRWCISGTELFGKAHIAEHKGNALSLCGVDVDSRNQVKWAHLCRRCEKIAQAKMEIQHGLHV